RTGPSRRRASWPSSTPADPRDRECGRPDAGAPGARRRLHPGAAAPGAREPRNLLWVEEVPAWHSNRFQRLTKARKRYLTDPALVSSVLRLDVNAFMRDAGLLGRLGRWASTSRRGQVSHRTVSVPACRIPGTTSRSGS